MQEAVEKWIGKRKYAKLLELWVKGGSVNWSRLYGEHPPRRISLPTYPFAKERYWVPQQAKAQPAGSRAAGAVEAARLHPLLGENTSDFTQQRYSTVWTGEEFFLSDHRVNGRKVLPGAAYLEMARAAVEKAAGASAVRLKHVVWASPVVAGDGPVRVHIGLYPEENGEIGFEVYREGEDGETVVHSQGRAVPFEASGAPVIDLPAVQAQCGERLIAGSACYEAFEAMGLSYGEAHRGIERIHAGVGQVLARLTLPEGIRSTREQYVMHPSLLDASLQSCIGLVMGTGTGDRPLLPFALEELEVFGPCTETMWARVRGSAGRLDDGAYREFDLELCDDRGTVCVRMSGFAARGLEGEPASRSPLPVFPSPEGGNTGEASPAQSVLLAPVWEPFVFEGDAEFPFSPHRFVMIGGSGKCREQVLERYPEAKMLRIGTSSTVEEIMLQLEACGPIEHILWAAPEISGNPLWDEPLVEGQQQGVLQVFRLVKSLLQLNYGDQALQWTVVTEQAQPVHKYDKADPTHASLHGFIGSMAKEFPHWKIRVMDVDGGEGWPLSAILAMPADPQGNLAVYRDGEWYRQEFIPVTAAPPDDSAYRTGGVYVVIGGAGGIGEAWTEYMIRTYQARILWIGRRALDAGIQSKLDRLSVLGAAPEYIQADASDPEDLARAYQEIKRRHTAIHGVIHSAIVLSDKSLAHMDEPQFAAALAAKVDVSVCLAGVFRHEPLDFVVFFSSFNAFTKSPGQSNYVAGCTFKDAFAHRLSQEWPCSVKIMNWGYWGSVGIVSTDAYQKQMDRLGIRSIEPAEAMASLELLLSGPMDQMALMNTSNPMEIQGVNWAEVITF
ncbi:SDR family oxidoreductase [Paenibacillus sp. S-38]|uniref:SDR family oxidoreductase n=1 Tax=Paenibacillus sp. S-38 TaxID=3416710 RepID=UPI003CE819B8